MEHSQFRLSVGVMLASGHSMLPHQCLTQQLKSNHPIIFIQVYKPFITLLTITLPLQARCSLSSLHHPTLQYNLWYCQPKVSCSCMFMFIKVLHFTKMEQALMWHHILCHKPCVRGRRHIIPPVFGQCRDNVGKRSWRHAVRPSTSTARYLKNDRPDCHEIWH